MADVKLRKLPQYSQFPNKGLHRYGTKVSLWFELHSTHWKLISKIFLLSSFVSWLSPREEGRFIVRSGEHVRLHEGGESVLWDINGGFEEGLLMDWK